MKKKKLALWAGIIGASCLFGAAIALFGISGDARTIALVLWSVVIITVYAIVTMSDGRKTVAKIQEVNRLLTEDRNIEGYIAGLNRLLVEEKDNFQAQQILRINLTVAYHRRAQGDQPQEAQPPERRLLLGESGPVPLLSGSGGRGHARGGSPAQGL